MTSKATSPPPPIYETPKHYFFYGHELTLTGSQLQNWFPSVFHHPSDASIRYPTAEHAIMHFKATLFKDNDIADKILLASTPREAGALGRQVKNFDSSVWKQNVDRVAEEVCYAKFSQVDECREALLATGDKALVEASPSDRVWGIGFRGDEAEGREEEWGRNVAGRALERVRARLREEGGKRESRV